MQDNIKYKIEKLEESGLGLLFLFCQLMPYCVINEHQIPFIGLFDQFIE